MTDREIRRIIATKDVDVRQLNDGGFSPNVLEASLYFINHTSNFSDAVDKSIKFAGPANFCPVSKTIEKYVIDFGSIGLGWGICWGTLWSFFNKTGRRSQGNQEKSSGSNWNCSRSSC